MSRAGPWNRGRDKLYFNFEKTPLKVYWSGDFDTCSKSTYFWRQILILIVKKRVLRVMVLGNDMHMVRSKSEVRTAHGSKVFWVNKQYSMGKLSNLRMLFNKTSNLSQNVKITLGTHVSFSIKYKHLNLKELLINSSNFILSVWLDNNAMVTRIKCKCVKTITMEMKSENEQD